MGLDFGQMCHRVSCVFYALRDLASHTLEGVSRPVLLRDQIWALGLSAKS